MIADSSLVELFLRHGRLPEPARVEAWQPVLLAVVEDAERAWPGLRPDRPRFVQALATKRPDDLDAADWLAALHGRDLYLTCACADGDGAAIDALEALYISRLPRQLGRRVDAALGDDVCQLLREKLLVGARDRAPRIGDYSGRGPLQRWLRVLALRAVIDLGRKRVELLGADERALAAASPPGLDPELALLRQRYHGAFKAALRQALVSLPADEQRLLRLHYVEKVTLDRLAQMVGRHSVTVVRRLAAARTRVLDRTQLLLREQLGLAPAELESLLRAVRSQLELSLPEGFG